MAERPAEDKSGILPETSIFFYGIPAYGHLHSNLYLTGCLSAVGYRVVYYSMEPYRREIEANGCEFRAYPLDRDSIDASDGDKPLKLYRLILEYTRDMLPHLLAEAEKEKPYRVIFDSLALWGRAVGEIMKIPSCSFYSIAVMDRVGGNAFWAYASGFSASFLRYAGEFNRAMDVRRKLRQTYGIRKLGVLSVLMNRGSSNLMGYSKDFQPGGSKLGSSYVFLGPLAPFRNVIQTNDFVCPDDRLIYISLGTVFNQDTGLLREILRQFGQKHPVDGEPYKNENSWNVVMVWNMETAGRNTDTRKDEWKHCDNFIIRPFVNQGEILKHADLFITAGGMNSIHEALYYGVPCLMCPQQGEQRLNAGQFEALGFGRILRDRLDLYGEAMAAMKLKDQWDEGLRTEMCAVHMEAALQLFDENK